jgi:glycosyltransferase involved in cell wall biosynthesis
MKPRVSVVINTRNEEANLPYALRSVATWVDEIVVVDMESEDGTVEIAESFGAKVFSHAPLGFADPARAFAVNKSTCDWILLLDADELVPRPLSAHLLEMAATDRADVADIAMRNFLLGAELGYTKWGPHQSRHKRFFKRNSVRMTAKIHNYYEPLKGTRIERLPAQPDLCLIHFNYVDIEQFLSKLNRYTSIEAEEALARGETTYALQAIFLALKEAVSRYFRSQGYRDGWRGLYLSLLMGVYRLVAQAKLTELRASGSRDSVLAHYNLFAEEILDDYDEYRA